jgi:hypothetical protein
MTIFDRSNAIVFDKDLLKFIMQGANTHFYSTVSIKSKSIPIERNGINFSMKNGSVHVTWAARISGTTLITVKDLLGRAIWSSSLSGKPGLNILAIPSVNSKLGIVTIEQNSCNETEKFCFY